MKLEYIFNLLCMLASYIWICISSAGWDKYSKLFFFYFFRLEQQQVCFEMVRTHLLLDFKYGVFLIFDLVFEGVSSLLISPAKLNGAVLLEMNLRCRLETATCNCLNLICSYWGWWQNDEILSCFSCCSTHEAGKLICIF